MFFSLFRRCAGTSTVSGIALAISLSACGGGGLSSTPPLAPPPAPSPVSSSAPVVVATQTVRLGPAASVSFAQNAAGASGTVDFAATTTGAGDATISMQSVPPSGVPAPTSIARRSTNSRSAQDIGTPVTPQAFITVNPTVPLSFSSTPAFTFTFRTGSAGFAYLIFFDPVNPQLGWNTMAGPIQTNGTNVALPHQTADSPPLALGPNRAYIFAIVVSGTVLPTAPKPYGITEYGVLRGETAGLNTGIASGSDGNLWFTEGNNDSVDKMTTDGTVTKYALPPPSNKSPNGITAGPDGNLWFAEYSASQIGRITTSGVISEYPLPHAGGPLSIAAGADGNLWFTEFDTGVIGRISPSGALTEFPLAVTTTNPANFAPNPYAIAAGPDGNMWFTEYGRGSSGGNNIGRITPSGVVTLYPLPKADENPVGIAAGPDGNMWFGDNFLGTVDKITSGGAISEYPLAFSEGANSIVGGPDGNIWLTGTSSDVMKITPSGTISTYALADPKAVVYGITVGPDHNIWFTDTVGRIGKLVLPR